MLEFKKPIPVIVEGDKDGYAIYVSNSGTFENDVWCIVLCESGQVRHYASDQVRIWANATFGIRKGEKQHNEDLKVGDKIIIINDKIGTKPLANVSKGEILTITGFSEDGKILYHNRSLALPVDKEIFVKIK